MYAALLCVVTLVGMFLHLRGASTEQATAVRAGSAFGASAVVADGLAPQTPAAREPSTVDAISLPELVQELRSQATTSTIPPPTTPTTRKPVPTTTARSSPTTTKPPAPAAVVSPTTAVANPLTPLTTLLARVVPPAIAVSGAVTKADSGVASWFNAPDATCAHRTLPLGTLVKVIRPYNGATATCKVNDRGPTVETGRLIDLSLDTFEKLAPKQVGLIDVTIEW